MIMKPIFTFFLLITNLAFVSAQLIIHEVYPLQNKIELQNNGSSTINVSGASIESTNGTLIFISNNLTFDCGGLTLAPGELLVFTLPYNIESDKGDLWLNAPGQIPSAYLQWGEIRPMATTAYSLGLWNDPSDFFPSIANNHSIELVDPLANKKSTGFLEQDNPTLCASNTSCIISNIDRSILTCHDNNTPSDPMDDYFTFSIKFQGINLPDNLFVEFDPGDISPTMIPSDCGNCPLETSPGTSNGESYKLVLSDPNGNCHHSIEIIAPPPCSPECELLTAQAINVECNNNSTSHDPSDDYLDFILRVWGINESESGFLIVWPNGQIDGPYPYVDPNNINTLGIVPAGSGDFTLIIQDYEDKDCQFELNIPNQNSCSTSCQYEEFTTYNVHCNDNNTPFDPSDDYVAFDLEVRGYNLSSEYNIDGTMTEVFPPRGTTNTINSFYTSSGSAGVEDLEIIVRDSEDNNCTITDFVANPGTCSTECNLNLDSLSITCIDNETPQDSTDDLYLLTIIVNGNNTDGTYTLSSLPFLETDQELDFNKLYEFKSPSIEELESNTYFLTMSKSGCTGLTLHGSLPNACSNVSSLTTTVDDRISLTPNPVSNQLKITISPDQGIDNQNIRVYSSTMRLVNHEINISSSYIDVSRLSSGIYYLFIGEKGIYHRIRFLKI